MSTQLPVILRPVMSCNTKPKNQAKIIAEKKDGTEIPKVLIKRITWSSHELALTPASNPKNIPKIAANIIDTSASIKVPLND